MPKDEIVQRRLAARENFISRLQLRPLPHHIFSFGGVIFQRLTWPRENSGAGFDRTVTIVTWPDGSWDESLDTGYAGIAEIEAEMRRMVREEEE